VYQRFFDDLEKRIEGGEDPKCFSRELLHLAKNYGFNEPQKYFCGMDYADLVHSLSMLANDSMKLEP
jgi:hypothetical protein